MTERHNIRFRVYQRSNEHTALLWDSQSLPLGWKDNTEMVFCNISSDEEKKVKFKLASSEELKEFGLPQNLVMAVVSHQDNGIDPSEPYSVKIKLGADGECLEDDLRVLPAGMLPTTECDNKFRNVHLYAFNKKVNKWQKLEGSTDKEGRFCMLVTMI